MCISCLSVILSFRFLACWERTGLLALLYVMFSCVFVTFPYDVMGQTWYLIVLIPDICLLLFFYSRNEATQEFKCFTKAKQLNQVSNC